MYIIVQKENNAITLYCYCRFDYYFNTLVQECIELGNWYGDWRSLLNQLYKLFFFFVSVKDKAEILQQVDELNNIKTELSAEVI